MASLPSGLRKPSSVKSSNSNISVASGGGGRSVVGAAEPSTSTASLATDKGGPMSRLPSSNSIRRKIATPAGINDAESRDYPASQSAPSSVVMTTEDPQIASGVSSSTGRTPSPAGRRDSHAKMALTPAMNPSLLLGERVIGSGRRAGVELLSRRGKNDGKVGGISYFNCEEKYGLFVRSYKVSRTPVTQARAGVGILKELSQSKASDEEKRQQQHSNWKEKHELFVAASKVISSTVNKAPRRHGSRESLISVSSMASSAASRSIRRPVRRESQCLPSCSLQSVLAEKEKHVERLIKERELDRVDLANLSRQFEDKIMELKRAHVDSSGDRQQLSTSAGYNEAVQRVQNTVEEERRKLEVLQYTLDEEKIMKADLQAQLDSLLAKSSDDSKKSDSYQAEKEELRKQIDELRTKLGKQISESKEASTKLVQAQTELLTMQKTIEEIRQSSSSKESEAAHKMELSQILTTAHQNEITALRDAATGQSQVVDKLNQQLADKKRREEELKEKVHKLEMEYETTLKQKCLLEAKVIDLVNSKTGTSELLTGKIKDLSQEVQDLREKLLFTEEEKAVLRRINAEFKSRLAKHEESGAALEKSVEEISTKLSEEKENIEKTMTTQVATLESEKQSLEVLNEKLNEELSLLNSKISEAEKSMQNASSSSKEQLEQLEKLKAEGTEGLKNLAEVQQLLEQVKEEKSHIEQEAQIKEKQLTNENNKLAEEVKKLSEQLSSTTDEASKLKKEIHSDSPGEVPSTEACIPARKLCLLFLTVIVMLYGYVNTGVNCSRNFI